jgi:hypothetical protein
MFIAVFNSVRCAVRGVRYAVCGTLIHAMCAMCAAVCGSARGCVAVRQRAAVRQCGSVW